jgi:hypothetical protein
VVRSAGGRAETLRLRPGERPRHLLELATGWAVAGTRQDEEGRGLIVITGGAGGQRRLGEPPTRQARHRVGPSLLGGPGGMEGIAWLEGEGPKSLAVRASRWTDQGWTHPEIVAPPARGSQTGLSGARLSDGRWLLVWSAFDGQDDEIMWSLGDRKGWTRPARVGAGNSVPDIVPTVIAAPGGALLAWNQFHGGQYQVMVARFQGAGWQRPRAAAPPGSVRPRLLDRRGRLLLTYREVGMSGWMFLELDRDGREIRRASLQVDGTPAPAVLEASAAGVRLLTPENRRETGLRWEEER